MEEGGSSSRCVSPQLLASDNADIRGRCLGMMSSASHLQMGEFCLHLMPGSGSTSSSDRCLSPVPERAPPADYTTSSLFTGSRSLVLSAPRRRLRKEEIYCCLASFKWQFLVIISPVLCNM